MFVYACALFSSHAIRLCWNNSDVGHRKYLSLLCVWQQQTPSRRAAATGTLKATLSIDSFIFHCEIRQIAKKCPGHSAVPTWKAETLFSEGSKSLSVNNIVLKRAHDTVWGGLTWPPPPAFTPHAPQHATVLIWVSQETDTFIPWSTKKIPL